MNRITNISERKIKKFFEGDILDFTNFPDDDIRCYLKVRGVVDLSVIKNENNKNAFKDLLLSILLKGKPYNYKSTCASMIYIFRLPRFLELLGNTDFLGLESDILKTMFKEYCDKNNFPNDMKRIIGSCQHTVIEYQDTRVGFDRDFWDKSIIKIAPERINQSITFTCLNFRLIKDKISREYTKLYMKHLLGHTEMSYTTISTYFSILSTFCKYVEGTQIDEVSKKQIMEYVRKKSKGKTDLINRYLNVISDFYKYLEIKQLLENPNPVTIDMFVESQYRTITNIVDEYVTNQIFRNLHKAPFKYIVMFLISYCCGTRISDICELKKDCLYYDGDGGYYVEFACQKMQKPLKNLIPKALYDLIKEQIKIINSLDYEELYLFPSNRKKNHPYLSQTFRDNFKKLCNEWNIKNVDGTLYNYTTHAYRHTLASDLYQNYGVPIAIIQKAVLGHKELQMTLSYVERPDEFKKMQEDRYIEKTEEVRLSKWLKDNLRGQVLSNGICGQPNNLGKCPASDACLTCEYFKTSKKFLPVLKNQFDTIKSRLPIYEANGYLPNLETAKEQLLILGNIIQKLEEMEE